MVYVYLVPVAVAFSIGSTFTYYAPLRNSYAYLPTFFICGFITSLIWTITSRKLDNTEKIMFFSFVWDFLMLLFYYLIPAIIQHKNINLQTYFAAILIIIGIIWFKVSIS